MILMEMLGLGLLVGHLVGDFWMQGDYLARHKRTSSVACAVHCFLYTFGVALFAGWWLPWWFLPLVVLTHFPVDRYGLARAGMGLAHTGFATGKLSPWSVVVMDQTIHLVTLFVLAVLGLALGPAASLMAMATGLALAGVVALALSTLPGDLPPEEEAADLHLWPAEAHVPVRSSSEGLLLVLPEGGKSAGQLFVPYLDTDTEHELVARATGIVWQAGEHDLKALVSMVSEVRRRFVLIKSGDRSQLSVSTSPVVVD